METRPNNRTTRKTDRKTNETPIRGMRVPHVFYKSRLTGSNASIVEGIYADHCVIAYINMKRDSILFILSRIGDAHIGFKVFVPFLHPLLGGRCP